jgi:hypothetical protein
MAGSLDTPNGLVLFGTASDVNVAVTPAVLANGVTFLSDPIPVPPGAGVVSFEIRASNVSGAPTLTVKVRGGNRGICTMIDRGIPSPGALADISGAVSAIVSIAADCAYIQLEIACSGGANANLSVVATVLRGTPAIPSAPSHQAWSAGVLVDQAQVYTAACKLDVISGYNANASQLFVQLHDKDTALVLGDVPKVVIPVPGNRASFSLAAAFAFATGLSVGISSTELTFTSAGNFLSYEALVLA